MSNVEQNCTDCTDQNVVNTGDGKGSDVIMMTGPLGDVFTKALAVYLSKTPVEGYNQVATESQSQDAMLTAVVASDAVKRNLASVKNMVEVATSDDAGIVPTAIAYVAPAQKVNDPETVILVQNAAKACKLANREFIFVVDAFKKDAVYGDFNSIVAPSDKDNDINFYNACKGFQRATESLYGSDVHVVVGMEQLSNYLVARYKHGYKVEDIREELAVAYKPAKKKAKPKDTDYASEGIVDFLKKLFGPKKKEEKQTQPGAETVEQKVARLNKSLENITAGEHAVNKIHVFKSGNLLQTLEHKAKQVAAIADTSLKHVEAIKFAVAEANKLVATHGSMDGYGDNEFGAVYDEISDIGDHSKKFNMSATDLKLFGQTKPNEQTAEGEFVTLRTYYASTLDICYYKVNYHIPKGGVEKVTLTDMDVSKIKNLVQSILSNISKMPVHYNGSSDIYYKLLEGFSKEAKALLHNEDLDYMLGSKTFDLVTDISEDVWQGDSHLSNAENIENIVDTLLNLTESLQSEDTLAEEGFKEWLSGLFKGKPVKENKLKENAGIVERLTFVKTALQNAIDSDKGDTEIEVSIPKASNSSDVKKVATWFVSTFDSAEHIVKATIDNFNENVKGYVPLGKVWNTEYSSEMEKEYNKLAQVLETKQRSIQSKLTSIYKGTSLTTVRDNRRCLVAPLDAVFLELPYIPEPHFDNDWFGVQEIAFPYTSKETYDKRSVKFTDTDRKSTLMSLLMAVDKAIDFFKEHDGNVQEDLLDMDSIHALSDFDEDCCYEAIKCFYRSGQNWGLRAIADRLIVISKELS